MPDLTIGNERKLIFNFAVPMLIGNIFQQLYNVINSIVVGNFLGKEALSSVGASFPVMFALVSLIIGLASGCGVIISQNFGAKKLDKVQTASDTMFIIIFVSSTILSAIGIFFAREIFVLIDLPSELIPAAQSYFSITMGGMVFAFGYNGIAALLRSLGDSKTPLYFLIFSTFINIVLDLIFVVYFKWGIDSTAYATVISQFGAFASGVIYINKKHKFLKINFLKLQWDKTIFYQSVKIGLPSGLQQMIVAFGMTAVFSLVNKFGTTVIAAYSVAGRIDSFAVIPAMNFSQALTAFAGQNLGAGKPERVVKGLKETLLMSSAVSIIISIAAFFWGDMMMGLFTPDKEVVRVGHEYLLIVSSAYIIFSAMFCYNAVFRGAGDTLIPMFITLAALWVVRLPISYLLSQRYDEIGIWWGLPLAWVFGMVVSVIYYYTGRWKKISIVK